MTNVAPPPSSRTISTHRATERSRLSRTLPLFHEVNIRRTRYRSTTCSISWFSQRTSENTKDWYVNVLGLKEGYTPDFKFPVYWLYIGDQDVLHLTQGRKDVSQRSYDVLGTAIAGHPKRRGHRPHPHFYASDLHGMIRRFEGRCIHFTPSGGSILQGCINCFFPIQMGSRSNRTSPKCRSDGAKAAGDGQRAYGCGPWGLSKRALGVFVFEQG